VEVADAGTPRERPKRPDENRGLLWRWNAYWRYEQVAEGVVVECESVTLSRTIPLVLRPVAGPIVGHVARESMDARSPCSGIDSGRRSSRQAIGNRR